MTVTMDDLANWRLRAEQGAVLCLHEHTAHRTDDGTEVWMTCGDDELARLNLGERTQRDRSDDIRTFFLVTMRDHLAEVTSGIVLALIDELERADSADKPTSTFRATVFDAGGGSVQLIVDRDAYEYPPVNAHVEVRVIDELDEPSRARKDTHG